MIIRGVDTSKLPDQFHGCVPGRTLILDGDGPCYEVAATVKRLDTAVRHFQQKILTQLFLTKAQDCRIHLTSSTSFKNGRFLVNAAKPYQGNRTGKAKPSLLEPLRQAVQQCENWLPEYMVLTHHELEADDGMIQDAYRLGENGIIWSDDKDLRMTPYPYWEKSRGILMQSQPFGYLEPKVMSSGAIKVIGQGPLFFWAQMLMGDTADNIKGLWKWYGKLCGPSTAYEALRQCSTIAEAANTVIDAYREIDQNPIAEGYLLWLLRWPGDNVIQYFSEVGLSDKNKEFVHECTKRNWFTSATQDSTQHDEVVGS